MSKDKHNKKHNQEIVDEILNKAQAEAEIADDTQAENNTEDEKIIDSEKQQIEELNKSLDEAKAAVEKEKKEYLFLLADFDNFRKRIAKEKIELIKNGGEKVLSGLLPIVDDFERGLEATKNVDDPSSIREGMELIYQKFTKFLSDNGVKPINSDKGVDFDTDLHEAIATIPAPDESLKGKIIDTTQKGYVMNQDKILRHAKVVVGE